VASVELRGLTKRYGTNAVVDDVSLRIEHGLLVCLLGPSGCGKTTTLRLIAGFVEPSGGEIVVGERVVSSPARTLPPEQRNMSMIFQSYALWPHMTVAENIVYGLKLRKMDSATIKKKLDEILATTRLAPLAQRYPGELSGGQQQRVALARALIVGPETLLLDEPLSNLDAKLRLETRTELKRLQRSLGVTTVYVTHDQEEAMTLADRIAVFMDGRIVQVGTPREIFAKPMSVAVAGFIGTPPMNLLAATVSSQNGSVNVILGRQQVPLSDEAMRRFPEARGREGREVVLGVRADNLHRADRRPDLPAINAGLELIEALGSQSIAYFRIDAMVIGVDDDLLEEQELAGEGVTAARPNLVAAMPAEEAVGLRAGGQSALAVDGERIHLFDADTGAPLR